MIPSPLNTAQLTDNQPFCAGVVIVQDNRLLLTLNPDGLPGELSPDQFWRIGGVGGGQEPDESIFECAIREGQEELSVPVELIHSPLTYFHDMDSKELHAVTCTDAVAPLLLERVTNPHPDRPYRPELPTGPYIYFGLFLARPLNDRLIPGDDVQGLLHVPIEQFPLLSHQPTLESLLEQGVRLTGPIATSLPHNKQVWLPADESFAIIATLLQRHPELTQSTSSR